jgi:hypothetical protein
MYKKMGISGDDLIKKINGVATSMAKLRQDDKKYKDSFNENLKNINLRLKAGALSAEELDEEMGKLRQETRRVTDAKLRAQLEEKKAGLEHIAAMKRADAALTDSVFKMGGILTAGIGKAFIKAGTAALSSGDAFTTAGAMLEAGLDVSNQAAQAGAGALSDFGKATAGAGGRVGKMGAIAAVAGAAISFMSNAVTELAKAGINFMLAQTKSLISSFQQLSAAGGVFAGGMQEQIATAQKANMTLESFSKAVAANSDALARTGLGMTGASKALADSIKYGGAPVRKGMFALGLSMEEQAAAYSTVMSQLSGPNRQLTSSTKEVSEVTQQYVRDLKTLQALTGEDLKSKEEKIRQENDSLAFQQKLAAMDPKKRADLENAMKAMTESQRRALRENMIYGTVISKDLAIAQATNSGVRKSNEEFAQAAKDGTLNMKRARDIQGENADATARDAQAATGQALSQNADVMKANEDIVDNWHYSAELNKKANAEAEKNVKDAEARGKKATGKGTTEADLMEMSNNFAVKLQQIAANNLPKFADALDTVIKDIGTSVASIGAGMASHPWLTMFANLATGLLSVLPLLIAARGGGGIGGMRGLLGGGAAAAGALKQDAGGRWRDAAGRFAKAPAEGGGGGGIAGMGEGLGKGLGSMGAGFGKLLQSVGTGGGKLIEGLMKGIAAGIGAFKNPQILLGAGILSASIAIIGAGIAGATWLLGKALPTLAAGLKSFSDLDGSNLIKVGEGLGAIGLGLGVFGTGSVVAGIGNFVGKLFSLGGSGPIDQVIELSKHGDDIKTAGSAMKALADGFKGFANITKKDMEGVNDFPWIRATAFVAAGGKMSDVTASVAASKGTAAPATGTPIKKYAEGGKIAAGDIGMVGEEGPEIIQGPADITPTKKWLQSHYKSAADFWSANTDGSNLSMPGAQATDKWTVAGSNKKMQDLDMAYSGQEYRRKLADPKYKSQKINDDWERIRAYLGTPEGRKFQYDQGVGTTEQYRALDKGYHDRDTKEINSGLWTKNIGPDRSISTMSQALWEEASGLTDFGSKGKIKEVNPLDLDKNISNDPYTQSIRDGKLDNSKAEELMAQQAKILSDIHTTLKDTHSVNRQILQVSQ